MPRNEADTRADLLDPALLHKGWTGAHLKREQSLGKIELKPGQMHASRGPQRTDYTLRIPTARGQAVAVGIVEAKAEDASPAKGLEQAKRYAHRLGVPFAFSSNGHLYVEHDASTGITGAARPLSEFPTPEALKGRFEATLGFALDAPEAKALTTPYRKGESGRRPYQDAAIRAALTRTAQGGKRVLLQLATGSGKTYIAANLLRKIADAGELGRALFLCDRDELRTQALGAMQDLFGADAAAITGGERGGDAKNARVLVGTYQTLGIDGEGDASFLTRNYPPGFFTHIVVDECHRSGFGSWRAVLDRNAEAVQIGLTATPRALENLRTLTKEDEGRFRDTEEWFGAPVYTYSMAEAFEDGYLATPIIDRMRVHLERREDGEETTGITAEDLEDKPIEDPRTGGQLVLAELRASYAAGSLEKELHLPERVEAMCADLFARLVRDWATPETKTIVFCASDDHAAAVAAQMGNLYARWCEREGHKPRNPYAVRITHSSGAHSLPDLRGAATHTFVATTYDLLSTGVDLPSLRNVVFFRYLKSAISVSQMVGRGTRLDPATGKLFFRIYDYTDATRLLGASFGTTHRKASPSEGTPDPDREAPRKALVHGFHVEIREAGRFLVGEDGRRLSLAEATHEMAQAIRREASDVAELRARWVPPAARRELMAALGDAARSASTLRHLHDMDTFDLWDFFAEKGFDADPLERRERAAGFLAGPWVAGLDDRGRGFASAVMGVFERAGTEGLEGRELFAVPTVAAAGGLRALGDPGRFMELRGALFS